VVGLAVTGSALPTLVSVEDEVRIGQEAQRQVKEKVPELTDGQVRGYVQSLGERLAAQAPGPDYPYSFSTANFEEINAFALPGGPVWINRGALDAAQTEAQIVSVLAHEIAHIAQRHAAEQLTSAVIANGILGLVGSLLGQDRSANAARIATGLFTQGLFLKFSRDDEREADQVGAQIMHRAGWDPDGMVEFFEVMRERQGRDPSDVEVFLSTHPSPEGRMDQLRAQVADMPGGRRSSEEFERIQQRLDRLGPAQSMKQS
jgi:predicted Zn-dependent protease